MIDLKELDVLNRDTPKRILRQLINDKVTTRAQIARDLKLNKSTVSSVYDDLKDLGIITEVGEGEASKVGGRKPTNIKLNSQFGYTISIDLAYHRVHFMVNYLDTSIIAQEDLDVKDPKIEGIIDMVSERIEHYQRVTSSINGLLGIGISIHGIVRDNSVNYSPFLDMDNVNIQQVFAQKYNVPVYLENESNLTGLYVRDFLNSDRAKNMIAISIHKGIGSGIIIDNKLFRGYNGEAGEIGRTLTKLPTGGYTTIEKICSEDAIINYARERIGQDEVNNRQQLLALLDKENPIVMEAIDQFISEISMLIYNASMNFDTKFIYIGSPLMEERPQIFQLIVEKIKSLGKADIKLILLDDADKACLLGSCSMITHQVLGLESADLTFKNK
ncbi:ROK family transcriptional regulator [Lentilactobacillus sp. SPB1-3]|uniref:ROK family protein n=1 Tax=Lentilactobacillus terminaliae TaxID=3003483 RepID=A0ACD5DF63_9LACO|nr:ROK family transcriptional regulator [Lentilactobacillus sp. SPB1-3]MCZ0976440.1 ROK family transcriptional regulator [Lentilactobacillus sp. SPB1-3]